MVVPVVLAVVLLGTVVVRTLDVVVDTVVRLVVVVVFGTVVVL